jgi:AraC family transcriptional regulator of adaptative response / DNA-3-methyladenine glycosylase II
VILAGRAPYDAAGLLGFLARRAVPGVEAVEDGTYRRSLALAHSNGVAELKPAADGMELELHLHDARDEPEAIARVRALLDLDADVPAIAAVLGADPLLGPHVARNPGRRVPGTVDGPELAVRAMLGQQISLAAAATHAARLVQAAGEPLRRPLGGVTHCFPGPEAIATAPDAALALPRARRDAIRGLGAALADGLALGELQSLRGIGPWTASYVAMRALRDSDAYLPTDLGVRHAIARLGHDGDSERWRPWRAYAVLHLWGTLES